LGMHSHLLHGNVSVGFSVENPGKRMSIQGTPQIYKRNSGPGDLAAFKSRPLPSLYLGALQFVRDVA